VELIALSLVMAFFFVYAIAFVLDQHNPRYNSAKSRGRAIRKAHHVKRLRRIR
jgi:hypothetical protein